MKTSRVILACCAALLLANLLMGCASTQRNTYTSADPPVLTQPNADKSEADGVWAMLQYPIYVGFQFLGSR